MDVVYFFGFIALLLFIGYRLALYRMRQERERLRELRQMVAGEMEAMYQVHRIHDAFVEAREALRRERRRERRQAMRVPPADRERQAG
jgi:hypothetical protein